jgi:hypothetical protein
MLSKLASSVSIPLLFDARSTVVGNKAGVCLLRGMCAGFCPGPGGRRCHLVDDRELGALQSIKL